MGERAEEMLRVALDSFARRDLAGAESLVELDELIDHANRRFVERLVDVMAEEEMREWGLRMVVVARTIERIGDRAVDIGEQTSYLLTAEFREFTDASHPGAPVASPDRHEIVTGPGGRSHRHGCNGGTMQRRLDDRYRVGGRARRRPRRRRLRRLHEPGHHVLRPAPASAAGDLVGAGSTLVAPLVGAWQGDYGKSHHVTITYGAIGSGGGIAQITAHTVDFAGSDAALTPDQKNACKGCVMIPWALAATTVAYNLPGTSGHVKLSGPVVGDIFLGKITHWNDPRIRELNPGATLPATRIQVVYRSDPSGDTYAFTDYLSKASPAWKAKEGGATTAVNWPAGTGGKGNSGVAGAISQTPGAIGYVAIAQTMGSHLGYALIRNRAGNYPSPSPKTIAAAAAVAELRAGQQRLDHRSARLRRERVPDLDVHVRDRAEGLVEAAGAEDVPRLRGHGGPEVRDATLLRAAPAGRRGEGRVDRRGVVARGADAGETRLVQPCPEERVLRRAAGRTPRRGRAGGWRGRASAGAARAASASSRRSRRGGSSAPRCRGRARPAPARSPARPARTIASSISPQCGSAGSRPVAGARRGRRLRNQPTAVSVSWVLV